MADSDAENLRPESKPDRIAALMVRIDAHEAEASAIAVETVRLSLDAKKLKAIRAARRTLDALMGIDPALAAQVQA